MSNKDNIGFNFNINMSIGDVLLSFASSHIIGVTKNKIWRNAFTNGGISLNLELRTEMTNIEEIKKIKKMIIPGINNKAVKDTVFNEKINTIGITIITCIKLTKFFVINLAG